ncbi:MAG TPA: hypothetical protein VG496_11025 [Myxococcales bacterium]|nr:hypothetical protein [Myxococcales bacterium]
MNQVRAALWSVCAFAIAYVLASAFRLPTIVYDPVGRVVQLTTDGGGVSMRYYGDLLWGCAAALAVAAFVTRRPPRPTAPSTRAALSIVALYVAFHLSRLFARV